MKQLEMGKTYRETTSGAVFMVSGGYLSDGKHALAMVLIHPSGIHQLRGGSTNIVYVNSIHTPTPKELKDLFGSYIWEEVKLTVTEKK